MPLIKFARWVVDSDGDIGLCFFGLFTFIKYKYSVLFQWGGKELADAPKYLMDSTIYTSNSNG